MSVGLCVRHDLRALLTCLWELDDHVPRDLYVFEAVTKGLAHLDPEVREYAIGVAYCIGATDALAQHLLRETEPWLVRCTAFAIAP